MTIKHGKLVILMILVAGVLVIQAHAQTELTVYIGRDDFDSEKWVSSLDNTVVNTTEGILILNQTMSPGIEDLTTWTELDSNNRYIVDSDSVTFTNVQPTDDNARVYLDVGAGNIGDFDALFEMDITKIPSSTSPALKFSIFTTSQQIDDMSDISDQTTILLRSLGTTTTYTTHLFSTRGGVSTTQIGDNALDVGTNYFVRMNKSGVDIGFYVYSDSERTTLVHSAELTATGNDTARYWIFPNALDFNSGGGQQTSGVISNLNIGNSNGGMVYVPTGDFYSIDLMENSTQTGIARNVFGIAEIPASTSLQVLTSDDNSTWTVNNVTEEFGIDLTPFNYTDLFVRFRLNTSNGAETPLVDFYYVTYDFNFTPGGINITILSGSFAEYNVSLIETRVGTYVEGGLNSTPFVDNNTYLVNEVTGVPGWDIRFNFTGIPENSTSLAFMAFADYEGNPAHDPHIEAYNFDLGQFVDMVEYGEGAFEWHNESLSIGGFIQADTGNVWIRFVHHMSGSNGHFINVDYLRLRAFVPTGEAVNVDAWGINWLLSIIWLVLMAIGVFKENKILIMFAGFFGIILSILMFTENMMVAVALICINLYLLYDGTA